MPNWKSWMRKRAVRLGTYALTALPKGVSSALVTAASRRLRIDYVAVGAPDGGLLLGSADDYAVFGSFVRDREYSPQLVRVLTDAFEGDFGGTFLDIGANIGLVTIPIAKLGVHCEAFEPEPEVFRLLGWNLRLSDVLSRVRAHDFGLYSKDATLSIARDPSNPGDNRLISTEVHGGARVVTQVPLRRLDDVLDASTIAHPLVVKMDTQGAELHVFEGGRRVLSQAKTIVMEFWPRGIRDQGGRLDDFIPFLERHFRSGRVLEPRSATRDDSVEMPMNRLVEELSSLWTTADDTYYDLVLQK